MAVIIQDVPSLSAAFPVDPPTVLFPLSEENNYARVYIQKFFAFSGHDATGVISSAGMFSETYLAKESDRAPLVGGYVSFNRHFAEIPSGFNTYEGRVLTLPVLAGGGTRTFNDTSYKVNRVWNDFFLTDNPQSITLSGAQRFLGVDGFFPATLNSGTDPTITTFAGWVASSGEIISEDATLSRYYGPIWRRQTPYVVPK